MSTVCLRTPPRHPTADLTTNLDIFIDNTHVELSLWDTAGQEEFDRLRSLSYDNTHAIMLCFSVCPYVTTSGTLFWRLGQVDSADSLENIETKWKAEIEENCPGVKLVLVALKCDLREKHTDEEDENTEPKRPMIEYKQGLQVAQKIKALRYLGACSDWSAIYSRTTRLLTYSFQNALRWRIAE